MADKSQNLELSIKAEKILAGRIVTEHDLLDLVTGLVEAQGSQTAVAESIGVSKQYLGDVLHGKSGISDKLAEKLGYERIVIFKRV